MTGLAARVQARIARITEEGERGTSLAELVVGMAIMTIFMAIFLGSIVLITSTANKVEATTISVSQTNLAFLRLDKTVRYASAISTPGVSVSGDWYLELDSPATTAGAGDSCTQLRIDSGQLQQRTWTLTGGSASAASAWSPISNNITNGSAATPTADVPFGFPVTSGGASSVFQRLQVTLIAKTGGSASATNRAQMTFTALNSDASLPSNATTCQQWGRP